MNILVLTYWDFSEALVQTYTLPYVKQIQKITNAKISLVCFQQKEISPALQSELDVLKANNIEVLLFKYRRFSVAAALLYFFAFCKLLAICRQKKITHIHAWCNQAGAIGMYLKKFSGRKLIIDSFEPHAESMVENETWKKESMGFKILFSLESKMVRKADDLILLTSKTKDYILEKYNFTIKREYIKPSCVHFSDYSNLNPEKIQALRNSLYITKDDVVGIYVGKFGGIYLEDEFFQLIKKAQDHWKEKFRFICLTPNPKDYVEKKLEQYGIQKEKVNVLLAAHNEVVNYLTLADYAVNPVKPVPSKRYCTSIKDGEYWASGLPVIITKDISDDSDIIEKNKIGWVLRNLNDEEYQKAILTINQLLSEADLKNRIQKIALQYRNFGIAESIYKKIYG